MTASSVRPSAEDPLLDAVVGLSAYGASPAGEKEAGRGQNGEAFRGQEEEEEEKQEVLISGARQGPEKKSRSKLVSVGRGTVAATVPRSHGRREVNPSVTLLNVGEVKRSAISLVSVGEVKKSANSTPFLSASEGNSAPSNLRSAGKDEVMQHKSSVGGGVVVGPSVECPRHSAAVSRNSEAFHLVPRNSEECPRHSATVPRGGSEAFHSTSRNSEECPRHSNTLPRNSEDCPKHSSAMAPQLRSVLKRQGQRNKAHHRVSFNEARNQFMEPDYVILFQEEGGEPHLVSIRSLELGDLPPPPPAPPVHDALPLSPPDGYKDCFNRALRHILPDDADDDRPPDAWADVHAPSCPRSNLPDLVSSQRTSRLTPESVRIHDPVLDDERPGAKAGILKNGKLWKRGESHKKSVPKDRDDSHRRSVRFSGRDEYTTVDCSQGEENGALSSNLSPKLQELSMLLGKDPWQLDLGSSAHDHHRQVPCDQPSRSQDIEVCEMEDEHIAESVKRYEEMRRRIAADEGRRNTDETDEVDSPSDHPPIDPATAESRIRRLENADIAHVAGGVLRSNSELRRVIEQNALRRSLIKFSDARKKDTNKNDRSDKQGSSILEKLKWLTATEDLTNGNSDDRSYGDTLVEDKKEERPPGTLMPQNEESAESEKPQTLGSVSQYRHLAEIFNQSTSVRSEPKLPTEVRERKHEQEVHQTGCGGMFEAKIDSSTYTAIPVVSFSEIASEDDADKLLYSGGVRYTREGTLMPPRRKELSVNKILGKVSRYTLNDIDEALHDDRSSSVPSSSQSSPRLSGRSDMDGTSTTESGYSSNETNGDHYSLAPLDELAEFVRQDAPRLERLRLRYQEPDDQDHGFGCRPAVKGIKPRYCTVPDHMQQQPMSVVPGRNSQQGNAYATWQGRESPHENTSSLQRGRPPHGQIRSAHLPSLHEDMPYSNVKSQIDHRDCPQDACCHFEHSCHSENNEEMPQGNVMQVLMTDADIEEQQRNSSLDRHCRTVEGYSLNNDHRAAVMNCPMPHEAMHQYDDRNVHAQNRLDFHNAGPQGHFGSTQSLQSVTSRVHHPSCVARRPISLHDQMLRDAHSGMPPKSTDLPGRPHSSLGQYSGNHYVEEQIVDKSHQPLTNRGSFPGNPNNVSSPTQYSDNSLSHRHGGGYQPPLPGVIPGKYAHSPQEILSPGLGSPVGTGGMSLMSCYPKSQQRAPTTVSNRCYPSHWNPNNGGGGAGSGGGGGSTVAVPSHLSYTTPVVPQTGATSLPKQFSDVLSKVDVLRDERGVPEGASSSPRSSYDSQYSSQDSPPRDQNLLVRHSALPLDLSS